MSDIDNTQAIMRKFEPMLRELSQRELVVLNKMVVERIRPMIKEESLLFMTKFSVGDRVSWTGSDGRLHTGIIIRLKQQNCFRPD